MFPSKLVLFAVLAIGGVCLVGDAGPAAADESGWIVSPLARDPATDRDRAARQQLLKVLTELQTPEFREQFSVDIPDRATGLPLAYDLLIYGSRTPSNSERIAVRVRGERATVEWMLPTRAYRLEDIPAEPVDQLARQLCYAGTCSQRPRTDDLDGVRGLLRRSTLRGSHTIDCRIEIRSTDSNQSFHLLTDVRQPLASTISSTTSGLPGYVHSFVSSELWNMAIERAELLPLGPELGREITNRLRLVTKPARDEQLGAVPVDVPVAGQARSPKEEIKAAQEELGDVERNVYSQLAVACRATAALPELQRLGMTSEAAMLQLAVDDPDLKRLREALLGDDWMLYRFALRIATSPFTARKADMLLDVWPNIKSEYSAAEVLTALNRHELSPAQLDRVRAFHDGATNLRLKVAAARLLLWATDDAASYAELVPLALKQPKDDGSDVYAPEGDAERALLEYAHATGKRRPEVAAFIRRKLAAIPASAHPTYSHKDLLVKYLGLLGDASDVPRLNQYISAADSHLSGVAITSIARLDPAVGLARAREEVTRYLGDMTGAVSFNYSVYRYLHLVFWRGDREWANLLEGAADKYASTRIDSHRFGEPRLTRLVANYLRADSADAQAKLAVEYHKLTGSHADDWTRDVGRRLIAAGADPQLCLALIEPPAPQSED